MIYIYTLTYYTMIYIYIHMIYTDIQLPIYEYNHIRLIYIYILYTSYRYLTYLVLAASLGGSSDAYFGVSTFSKIVSGDSRGVLTN